MNHARLDAVINGGVLWMDVLLFAAKIARVGIDIWLRALA